MTAINPSSEPDRRATRRQFCSTSASLAGAALCGLLDRDAAATAPINQLPHFRPRAARIIYLCQSGAPSQLDLFDPKPLTHQYAGQELPASIRGDQRLTTMTSSQKSFPVTPSLFRFAQHGTSGAWVSELLPHLASVVDELCFVHSLHTEAINHDPAITFMQTGSQQAGRPSMGAWVSYGLGSDNRDLPDFVALVSSTVRTGQPLYSRLWGSGFLPTRHQGVQFRGQGDPVLHLSNPAGMSALLRGAILGDINALNRIKLRKLGDPEIATRIAQYELAYRMQSSVPELTDLSSEPQHVLEAYGPESQIRGSYAANCLLGRRLLERGVRFVQLFHRGWDQHQNLPRDIRRQCLATDQPTAALIRDLKQRGLLEDTLLVWGGEFGRTVYCQGVPTPDNYGRDHHPRCFTGFLAGGGVQGGLAHGKTDDFSYNITTNPVPVHDLNATILHCLGIDHLRHTFLFQGRHHRLTDVHGKVVKDLLS
ncbi:MAG: DUF1501 domain-containing protein [Planctomycetota bacterium]|nr:DUF1501 domain-containing protein [Planctomycetota bacterium]